MSDRPTDVLVSGTVYFDLVFSGLSAAPMPGREVRTAGLEGVPGGAANVAMALARLGLQVRLHAAFAHDLHGEWLHAVLTDAGVDLSASHWLPDWRTPMTVSLAYAGDRSMITHELPQPEAPTDVLGARDLPRALFVWLGQRRQAWLPRARALGVTVFADVGWDESERWPDEHLAELRHVDVFLPNEIEATSYTRTAGAGEAARVLARLVPLAVVKCGRGGAVASDGRDGPPLSVPGLELEALDTTGAGDVFDAAFIFGTLAGWGLAERLRFGNLVAGLSVRRHGGSLGAPTWSEIAAFVRDRSSGDDCYDFLAPHLEPGAGEAP
ncbi:MAG TPA: PfkB family carbohydrate kinase [Candidatus Limnocylindrales bacterium]|nr:PfkB family carbohydrate kinase [Candidatus Limnocylindrales bacterium]